MTTREILKQSGLSDADIDKLDAKILSGFETVLTTASTAEQTATKLKEEAELAQRAQTDFYQKEIAPALDGWANEKATLEATVEFYKKQNEGARAGGFIPKDAPGYTAPAADPARDPGNGRYVPGKTGSPEFQMSDVMAAVSNAQWGAAEYQRLYGTPMPDDFDTLLKEATAQRLSYRDHVSKKFNFEGKKAELNAAKQKEHDDAIRKEERAKADKEWAERTSNNPNLRPASASQFAGVRKAVESGQVKDPLKMSPEERRQQTRTMIHTDISESASQGNA